MNSVSEEFKNRLPRLAANIALALVFLAIGTLSSVALSGVTEGVGFYSWLVFTVVGGAFLVRALFHVLTVGDRSVDSLMARLGIQQRLSKRRMRTDLICIIATLLATFAIFPFFENLGTVGAVLQSVSAIVAIGIIFLFLYDVVHTLYRIFRNRASAVVDLLVQKQDEETR